MFAWGVGVSDWFSFVVRNLDSSFCPGLILKLEVVCYVEKAGGTNRGSSAVIRPVVPMSDQLAFRTS